jgi:hypothetical protein
MMAEAGLPGVEASVWNGFFVPSGTPKPIIDTPSAISLLACATIVVDDCKRASEVSNIVHCSAVICIRRRSVLVRHLFTLKSPGSFQLPAIKPKRRSREAVTR